MIYRTGTMGDHFIRESSHTSKKSYRCASCDKHISKGKKYVRTVGTYDGYFVDAQWHPKCREDYIQYLKERARER